MLILIQIYHSDTTNNRQKEKQKNKGTNNCRHSNKSHRPSLSYTPAKKKKKKDLSYSYR